MHGINLNPLFVVDSCEISCSSSTVPSKPLLACVSLTWMNASSPQSESLEQTTLEVDSPVGSILPILSDQGKCKICENSQAPFNQFSFSILSLFLRLKTGPNYTRKDVDQKRILNPYFEQPFCRMLPRLPIISLSMSTTTMFRFSSSLFIAPTKNEKLKDRLMLGNRYTLISNFKTVWVSSIGNSNLRHFSGTET